MWKHFILLTVTSVVLCDVTDDSTEYGNPDEMFDDDDQLNNSSQHGNMVPVGDMLLTKEQYDFLYNRDPNKRVGFTVEFKRWPNGVVPIKIKEGDYSKRFQGVIHNATQYIMARSCIEFRFDFDPSEFPNYVLVNLGDGKSCRSQVGNYRKGEQQLQIHEKCSNGSIVHEMLHTLGFLHMHTAPNRGKYVKIILDNIKPFAMNNFKKASGFVGMFKTPYDYNSIMHYSRYAFAKVKGKTTIQPMVPVEGMGQRERMSQGDIIRLNRMYKCPRKEIKHHSFKIQMPDIYEIEKQGTERAHRPDDSNSSKDKRPDGDPNNPNRELQDSTKRVLSLLAPLCKLKGKLEFLSNFMDIV